MFYFLADLPRSLVRKALGETDINMKWTCIVGAARWGQVGFVLSWVNSGYVSADFNSEAPHRMPSSLPRNTRSIRNGAADYSCQVSACIVMAVQNSRSGH